MKTEANDPLARPDSCVCCWIMGYGVDASEPNVWSERILVIEEGCPDHGEQAS